MDTKSIVYTVYVRQYAILNKWVIIEIAHMLRRMMSYFFAKKKKFLIRAQRAVRRFVVPFLTSFQENSSQGNIGRTQNPVH